MIGGINDTPSRRRRARRPAARRPCARQPDPDEPGRPHAVDRPARCRSSSAFAATLRAAGIATTIRRNRGQEIGAACGQLAAEHAGEPPAPDRRRAAASGSSPRAPRPCAASAATTRCRPGWGSDAAATAGQRACGSRRASSTRTSPNLGDEIRRAENGRRRPHPPRRHGRPLRPEPHVRLEDDRGGPAAAPSCPFDAHLMISEPGRWIDEFLDAGCDSITFHVEVEAPHRPTLRARSARPVGRPGCRSSPPRRWPRSSRTASCSTSCS